MKFISLFFAMVFFTNLGAQETTVFAPIGAIWHYNSYENFNGSPIYFKFVVEKDTLIIGQNARLLRYYVFENDTFHADNNLDKYVFTNGNKVYYKVENEFVILFDFGAPIGDTIHTRAEDYPVEMGCFPDFSNGPIDYSYRIDSVGNLNVNGINLRLQYIHVIDPPGESTPWFFINPIIERIGANDYAGFWWGQGGGCILENDGFLRCYEDSTIFYKNPNTQFHYECDYTETKKIDPIHTQRIYPNPTCDFIYLEEKADIINIYNSIGGRINAYTNLSRIDLSDLTPNIYFIQYQIKNQLYTEKFIKL